MSAPTAAAPPRDLPHGAHRNTGPLGLLALAVRTELAAALRSGQFLVGIIAVPVILYAMFALPGGSRQPPGGSRQPPGGTSIATLMLASSTAYAAVSCGIFICGESVAAERRRGWTRTLAATPLPTWVHLSGKVAVTATSALAATGALAAVAVLAGGVRLGGGQWLGFTAVTLAGAVAFSTPGLAISYLVRPKTAIVLANLIFLPLSFCSGFFIPLGQLLWRQVAPPQDVAAFVGAPLADTGVNIARVTGCFIACAVIAALAVHREAVTRRG